MNPRSPDAIAGTWVKPILAEWIEIARRSLVYAVINTYLLALLLHSEYRAILIVWCFPPLLSVVYAGSHDGEDLGSLFGALAALRILMQYLAELFISGDTAVVERVLRAVAGDAVLYA